jgi:hypothetical protein
MELLGNGKPDSRALASRQDAAGLKEAAGFQDIAPGADGGTVDHGAPVREVAMLALGGLGSEAVARGRRRHAAPPMRIGASRIPLEHWEAEG